MPDESVCPTQQPVHRLHCNVYVTRRIDWYVLTDLDDTPLYHARNVASALAWAEREGYDVIRLRAGKYEGELRFSYQPYQESEIIHSVEHVVRSLKGTESGENNSPITRIRR
jgi:hypothetical protein